MSTRASHTDVATLLEERLRELLASGTPLDVITTDSVVADIEARLPATTGAATAPAIGSDEQVEAQERDDERFHRELRHRASRTRRPLYVSGNELGAFFPTRITSVDDETGQAIAEIVGSVAERLQVGILFEEKPGRGRLPELWVAPGWLRVLTAQMIHYNDADELWEGYEFSQDLRRPARGETVIEVDDVRVAVIEVDRTQLRMSLHPFDWYMEKGWGINEGAETMLERVIAEALLGSVDPRVKARFQSAMPVGDGREASRLTAVRRAVEMLRPLIAIQQRALPQRIASLDTALATKVTEIAAAQTALLSLLASKNQIAQERELLEAERAHTGIEVVVSAAREAARIAAMGSIREVGVIEQRGGAQLRVTWHPVVLEDDGSAHRTHHLVHAVTMRIPLNAVDGLGGITVEEGSCHPHVSSGKNICWGEAQGPVQQAIARGEFAAAVTLITGWVTQYNRRSPYTSIDHFPSTELALGFHPEIEV